MCDMNLDFGFACGYCLLFQTNLNIQMNKLIRLKFPYFTGVRGGLRGTKEV